MESYTEYKQRTREEIGSLPIMFAFNEKQFRSGMEKLGLHYEDTSKVVSVPGGGFMLKEESKKLTEMCIRHDKEFKELMESDKDGTGFMFQAFNYELANHEYCITYDTQDALDSLGLTLEQVKANPAMLNALKLAMEKNAHEY